MLKLDAECVNTVTDAIARLAGRARREPLLDAAAQAQACDRPKILLASLDRVRESLDEIERLYLAGLKRAGVELEEADRRQSALRDSIATLAPKGPRPVIALGGLR
jgi:hypothetical protein